MTSECKILLITSKEDVTTDFIVQELSQQNTSYYRFNTDEIGKSIFVNFDFQNSIFELHDEHLNRIINLSQVKSVYFRRPEIDFSNQGLTEGETSFVYAELAYMLEGLYRILNKAFWINKVWSIRQAENKIYQLQLAKEIGFKVPRSLVSNIPAKALEFYKATNQTTIIKPIKSGLVEAHKEEGVIFTSRLQLNETNIERVKSCPVYIQELIVKQADVRVTTVGKQIFPVRIESQDTEDAKVDWRRARNPLPHARIDLPRDIIDKCLKLTARLDLTFGAIDFILDEKGNFVFLEINPNGQWAWIEKQTGCHIAKEITNLLIEKAMA